VLGYLDRQVAKTYHTMRSSIKEYGEAANFEISSTQSIYQHNINHWLIHQLQSATRLMIEIDNWIYIRTPRALKNWKKKNISSKEVTALNQLMRYKITRTINCKKSWQVYLTENCRSLTQKNNEEWPVSIGIMKILSYKW